MKLKEKLTEDVLEALIMIILEEKDMAGCEILNAIEEKTNKLISNKNTYSIIYRLKDKGVIENYWSEKDIPYKQYKITPKGREIIVDMKKDLYEFMEGLNNFTYSN